MLIKPEDLKPVTLEETEFTETAHENVAKKSHTNCSPVVEPAPVIPTAPPITPVVPKVDAQKAAADAKAAEAADKRKLNYSSRFRHVQRLKLKTKAQQERAAARCNRAS